jgi:hypothetical protein
MIGSYSDSRPMDDWYRQEAVPVAVKSLSAYPILNSILNGFAGLETKRYKESKNFVLLNCLPTVKGLEVKEQLDEMAYYERALSTFDVMRWTPSKLEKLKSRIRDDKFDPGLTAYTEFMVAQRLVDVMGRSMISIYPQLSNGKESDLLVSDGSERVYVEIGNLSDSLPDRIIERILNSGAAYIGPEVTSDRYFQVEVETANMVFDANGIDEQRTVTKLKQEIDDLALIQLVPQDGFIDIREAARISADLAAYDTARKFMPENLGKIVDSFKDGQLRSWASSADFSKLNKTTMVQSVISLAAKSPLVEFHTKGFYPSTSAEKEMSSFANHIERHIKAQIASGQVEASAANIILVQGYNWMVRNLAVEEAVNEIILKIRLFLAATPFPDISGVGFFSRYPDDGYFIPNPRRGRTSALAEATVKALGMKNG